MDSNTFGPEDLSPTAQAVMDNSKSLAKRHGVKLHPVYALAFILLGDGSASRAMQEVGLRPNQVHTALLQMEPYMGKVTPTATEAVCLEPMRVRAMALAQGHDERRSKRVQEYDLAIAALGQADVKTQKFIHLASASHVGPVTIEAVYNRLVENRPLVSLHTAPLQLQY